MNLSSITIAKNEAANIARCLESLSGVADEIIVLIDSASADATESIVRDIPHCRYEIVQWQGFAKTKEYAVSLTTNQWVFWIDADEALSPALREEILALKTHDTINEAAFAMPRIAFFLNRWIKHSGWYPGYITRIFDKERARFTVPEVHEGLIIEGTVTNLRSDLLHYTDPDIRHYFTKFNNYTTLAALDLNKNNKKFNLADILIRPPFLFLKMYVFKAGFLDGLQGLLLALFSAFYVLVKYAKLWEKETNKNANPEN
ncbi:MAG: glycosyltransferase family 2 protein [Ignavibacteriales bacterium]|nr:glycosyltransferase family 2 protein [Ignavibacteriales bacterium]